MVTKTQIEGAQGLIQLLGYACSSVYAMTSFLFGGGYVVVCNGGRYTYELEDKGGNWVVTVK